MNLVLKALSLKFYKYKFWLPSDVNRKQTVTVNEKQTIICFEKKTSSVKVPSITFSINNFLIRTQQSKALQKSPIWVLRFVYSSLDSIVL